MHSPTRGVALRIRGDGSEIGWDDSDGGPEGGIRDGAHSPGSADQGEMPGRVYVPVLIIHIVTRIECQGEYLADQLRSYTAQGGYNRTILANTRREFGVRSN